MVTLFVFMQGCNESKTSQTDKAKFDYTKLQNYDKDGSEMSIGKAKKYVKAYKEQFKNCPNIPDSMIVRSVHFEFGPLMRYIEKMDSAGATGVRIYFANYDGDEPRDINDGQGGVQQRNLKGYNTVIFTATETKPNGEIHDILTGKDSKPFLALYQPYNGGVSCPPYPSNYCRGQGLIE
jgi:hypothetical protein